jgi:pimeloyl-ACP methyl ester carboxylesterase
LRGYHLSAKPRGVGAYRIDRLAEDLRALLDELGPAPQPVVAHDWGAAVAWWGALLFPERFSRLAILNAPHPTVFRRALRSNREQRRRSRYFFYFQLPWLPERKLAAGGFRKLRSMFRRASRPGTFADSELDRYAAAAAVPGALTAMLNWYRAALRRSPPPPLSLVVEPPVRIIWGTRDVALGEELVAPSARLCRRAEVFRLPEAGHWVQHEEPERVNRLLLDFLAA